MFSFTGSGQDKLWIVCLVLLFIFGLSGPLSGQTKGNADNNRVAPQYSGQSPNKQYRMHDISKVAVTITNSGQIGTGWLGFPNCGGVECSSCEYPKGSNINYLYGIALWAGAVAGQDTLVSVGASGWFGPTYEFWPDSGIPGAIIRRSNIPTDSNYSPDARANLEYLTHYFDTLTDAQSVGTDPVDQRSHIPLGLSVNQNSYSWVADDVDDFILFEYNIKSIGAANIDELWIGFLMDGDVYHDSNSITGLSDDIAGYLPSAEIAYIMDNDGDPAGTAWDSMSPRGAMGLKFHAITPTPARSNFNWWVSNANPTLDFGPRLLDMPKDPFRVFGAHLGTPTGDRNKYYILSHQEFDYDQLFTAVSHEAQGFLPPPDSLIAVDIADGGDVFLLCSFGPYNLGPGDSILVYYSLVMGDSAHVEPDDYALYFNPLDPGAYYSRLDFSDLVHNADAADSVYHQIFESVVSADDDGTASYGNPRPTMLLGNAPNPFNAETRITYYLENRCGVKIDIFNLLGQNIATPVDETQPAGVHAAYWNGTDRDARQSPSGIYFYRLSADGVTQTRKMLLLK